MDQIRSAAVYNREGHICGVFLFHSGECIKYILSEAKGGKGLLAEVAPSVIGMSEKVFITIFTIFIRNMNWSFSNIYEQDVASFRNTYKNIIDEINKSVNATFSPEES
jgi:hypothetical protein